MSGDTIRNLEARMAAAAAAALVAAGVDPPTVAEIVALDHEAIQER